MRTNFLFTERIGKLEDQCNLNNVEATQNYLGLLKRYFEKQQGKKLYVDYVKSVMRSIKRKWEENPYAWEMEHGSVPF